ncbi:hypothetical protein BX666DRAFT_1622897 [Dichotomocladium elegans]|nr:hypothetical protein BX666DRAFT_1622897 [Dichotomocladium elegans]
MCHGQLSRMPTKRQTVYRILLHILELHHLEPEYFIPGILHLSEADYVAKIWAPVLEILFRGTKAWCHWGDTLSEADNKLSFRMDLRILCRTVESNDACDGELGREISTQKYYHDKIKLILNGLHQLHDINNKCKTNDTSMFLGSKPACDIAASVTEFIDALTLLKTLVLDGTTKIEDRKKRKRHSMSTIISESSTSTSRLPFTSNPVSQETMVWLPPKML